MSRILFCANPKQKKMSEIVTNLKKQGINAELCKKAASL